MPTPCVPSAYTLGFTAHPQSLIAPPFELEFDCFFSILQFNLCYFFLVPNMLLKLILILQVVNHLLRNHEWVYAIYYYGSLQFACCFVQSACVTPLVKYVSYSLYSLLVHRCCMFSAVFSLVWFTVCFAFWLFSSVK